MRFRLLSAFVLALGLLGCSSSEDGGSIPTIVTFTPASSHLNPGGSTVLVANFLGGSATVDQGIGAVSSGVPIPINPAQSTTYTLTVTGTKGDTAVAKAVVNVGTRSLEITPATVSANGGNVVTFTANAVGLTDPSVKWFAEQGTIDAAGVHTVANRSTTYQVTATSVEDPTLCAKAFVTASKVPITISSETPGPAATVVPGQVLGISWTIFGASNPAVTLSTTWGSVVATGPSSAQFTTPFSVGEALLTIRSVEDPTVSYTITITAGPFIQPGFQNIAPGSSLILRAACLGLANPNVTWSVDGGGTINGQGVFTSDGTAGFHIVTATTVNPPGIAGIAFVNVNAGLAYTNTFSLAGTMGTPRTHHALLRTQSNLALVSGGEAGGVTLSSLELYNPSGSFWTAPAAVLATPRSRHTATLLPTHKILIVGGRSGSGSPLASAELYDPNTDTMTPVAGSLATAREDHTATLMADGRVLIAGGRGPAGTLASVEIFNPATNTFSTLGTSMSNPRVGHAAEVLLDGRVLLAGGSIDGTDTNLATTANLYNPFNGTLTATAGNLPIGRRNTAGILAPSGTLTLFGGVWTPSVATADSGGLTFNPATGTFASLTATMSSARNRPLATPLGDGTALLVGGSTDLGATGDASGTSPASTFDVFNPGTGGFPTFGFNTPPVGLDALNGKCLLMYDGSVVIVGSGLSALGAPVGAVAYQ
jgi:hypothetical protein